MTRTTERALTPVMVQLYAWLYRAGILEVKKSGVSVDTYSEGD